MRGWWIEPLTKKFAKNTDEEQFVKRVPIHQHGANEVGGNLHQAVEVLRQALLKMNSLTPEERSTYEPRVANIKFLVSEIDKKVVQKKAS